MSKKKQEEIAEEGLSEIDEQEDTVTENTADVTDAADTGPDGDKGPEMRIKALEEEAADLKDQLLRKQADFDNFRKRMIREKEESIKYANTGLLSDLVMIIDDFERAIKSSEESKDFTAFHAGIEMIEKQFVGMLERNWGLKRFESVGEEFDPEKHEAIAMAESSEYDVQTVLDDYQKGYTLHDRVLRHAKVRVSMPAAQPDKKNGGDAVNNEQENE